MTGRLEVCSIHLMETTAAARCPRCNATEDRHNDDCPIVIADLEGIAGNPHFTKLYRQWARRELRSIKASKRRQAS